MAASEAQLGYGTVLSVDDGGGFDEIAEITSIKPPGFDDDEVEVTHMTSPNGVKEFIAGLKDNAPIEGEMNFVPANYATLAALRGQTYSYRIVFPDTGSTTFTVPGFLQKLDIDDPVDDKMTASFTIRTTGPVVVS